MQQEKKIFAQECFHFAQDIKFFEEKLKWISGNRERER